MTTEAQIQGLGEYVRMGFTLEHPDDHILLLLHEGEQVAHFSQLVATEKSLQEECASHLVIKHGWNGCLWSRNEKGGGAKE